MATPDPLLLRAKARATRLGLTAPNDDDTLSLSPTAASALSRVRPLGSDTIDEAPDAEDPLVVRARQRMERISSQMAETVEESIPAERRAPRPVTQPTISAAPYDRLADKPTTRGASAGFGLGYIPGSELGVGASPLDKIRYGIGYMAGSIPYAIGGSVLTRGAAAAVASRAPEASRAARIGRYLSEAAPAPASAGRMAARESLRGGATREAARTAGTAAGRRAATQAGVQNVAEGLAFSGLTEPVRKLDEGESRLGSVALNTGVGMAIDLPMGVVMGRVLGPAARATGATRPRPVPVRAEIPPPERTPRGRVERGAPGWMHGIDDRMRVEADPREPMSQAAAATRRANELRAPDRLAEDEASRLVDLQGRAALGETPSTPLILGPDGRPVRIRPGSEIEEPGPVLRPRPEPQPLPESRQIPSVTSGPRITPGEAGAGPDWNARPRSSAEPLLYGPDGPVRRTRPGESVPEPQRAEDPLLAAARRRAEQLRAAGEDDPRKLVTDVAGEALEETSPEVSLPPKFRSKAADHYAAEAMATEDPRTVFAVLASASNDTKVSPREKQGLIDFLTQRLDELGGAGGAPAVEPPLRTPPAVPGQSGETPPVRSGGRGSAVQQIPPETRQKVRQIIREKRSAQRAAETDPLTGAGNRAAWEKARGTAEADPNVEVVAFDLNNLKALNDLVGHDAGDAAIRDAVEAVRQIGGPRVFRLGGDEIVALVPAGKGGEVAEGAARAFGERPAGDFTASLTGTVGRNFSEADAGLQAAKQARKGPGGSFRDLDQSGAALEPAGSSVAPGRVGSDTARLPSGAEVPRRSIEAAEGGVSRVLSETGRSDLAERAVELEGRSDDNLADLALKAYGARDMTEFQLIRAIIARRAVAGETPRMNRDGMLALDDALRELLEEPLRAAGVPGEHRVIPESILAAEAAQDEQMESTLDRVLASLDALAREGGREADEIELHGATREALDLTKPDTPPREHYIGGDRVEFTGKTQELHGGTFHEFRYLEGHKKGQTGVTQRGPDLDPAAPTPDSSTPEVLTARTEFGADVDASLAPILDRLTRSGVKTIQSDSGVKADHPGRAVHPHTQGYIAIAESDPERRAAIRRAAKEAGLSVDEKDETAFFQPGVTVRVPASRDLAPHDVRNREATALAEQELGVSLADLKGRSGEGHDAFMDFIRHRDKLGSQIIERHGGPEPLSDSEVMRRWERFAEALERPEPATSATPRAAAQAAKTVDAGERLTGPEGSTTSVVFPDNQRVQARYRVVEAGELQPSHNPDTFAPNPRYPADVQGRRYDLDPAAQERVTEAVQGFDPERALDPTSEVGAGPPLITPDGIAVAGNQRSMMLQRLARDRPDAFARYREALGQRAEQLGLDPEQLAGMRAPVLVREIADAAVDLSDRAALRDLNRRSDISVGKTKDPLSDATSRAARLRDDPAALEHLANTLGEGQTLRDYLRGAEGKRFVQMLEESRVMERGELAALRDSKSGALTDQGADVVERMLQVAAIGDPEVVAVTPKALLGQMEHAYPAIMRAATSEGWDLRGSLQEALRLHAELKGQPAAANIRSVGDLVSGDQGSLLGRADSPEAVKLASFLEGANKTETKAAFHRYAQEAEIARRQGQSDDLFGFTPKKPGEAFDDTFGATDRMNKSTKKPCR